MTADLLSLREDPFELLAEMERRLQTSRVDLAAGATQFWTGLGFRLGERWVVAPREDVREGQPWYALSLHKLAAGDGFNRAGW